MSRRMGLPSTSRTASPNGPPLWQRLNKRATVTHRLKIDQLIAVIQSMKTASQEAPASESNAEPVDATSGVSGLDAAETSAETSNEPETGNVEEAVEPTGAPTTSEEGGSVRPRRGRAASVNEYGVSLTGGAAIAVPVGSPGMGLSSISPMSTDGALIHYQSV